ncbi:MAG: hypothetical protein ACE5JE_06445 [Thermoplasmata archaeon]
MAFREMLMRRKTIVGAAVGLVGAFLLALFLGSLVPPPAGPSSEWKRVRVEVIVCSPETSTFPPGLAEDPAPRPFDGTRTIIAYIEEADGSITECWVSVYPTNG